MKTILKYGQTVLARNKGQADNLQVFQSAVEAVKDGYAVKGYERIITRAGTFIRKRRSGVVQVGNCIFIGFEE